MCRRHGSSRRSRKNSSSYRPAQIVRPFETWRSRPKERSPSQQEQFGKRFVSSCRDALWNAWIFQVKKVPLHLYWPRRRPKFPDVSISQEQVREALRSVRYPGFSRDIVSFGLVKDVQIHDGEVKVQLALATNDPNIPATIKNDAAKILRQLNGVRSAKVLIDIHAAPAGAGGGVGATRIPGIKHIIAIASGKGGVGKSTVAANLAVAIEQTEARVGLCDCDIYGPSISLMFGTRERPTATDENKIVPIEQYHLKLMSMGFLLDDASPAILRGPMVTRYTQQFLRQVDWGELDFLVLDLPPGTGDIQLTIVQTVALAGAIIVTTPQEVALIDARKAATMFEKVNVPVLGLIENMSYFVSPSDHKRYDIFGSGGGEREAKRLRVPLLGQIPIDIATREAGDRGMPIVAEDRPSPVALEFSRIARELLMKLN